MGWQTGERARNQQGRSARCCAAGGGKRAHRRDSSRNASCPVRGCSVMLLALPPRILFSFFISYSLFLISCVDEDTREDRGIVYCVRRTHRRCLVTRRSCSLLL